MPADEPVVRVGSMDLWFVTRWADVEFVRYPELFTANTHRAGRARCSARRCSTSTARPTTASTAMKPPFAASTAGSTVRDDLPQLFDGLIDGFVERGRAELITERRRTARQPGPAHRPRPAQSWVAGHGAGAAACASA